MGRRVISLPLPASDPHSAAILAWLDAQPAGTDIAPALRRLIAEALSTIQRLEAIEAKLDRVLAGGVAVAPPPADPLVAPTPSSLSPITLITPTPSCPNVRVNAEQVNLRPSPGTDEPPLRKLYLDEPLAVLECSDVPAGEHLWWRVVGEDGQEGWVATTWLEAVR